MFENVEPDWLAESQQEDQWILTLKAPANLDYFRGHFTDTPVLPGVVQIHWAIRQVQQRFAAPQQVARLEVVKFQQLLRPEEQVQLVLGPLVNNKLSFSYQQGERRFSSGRIQFVEHSE